MAQSMALHTRYPGHNGHKPVPGSPLGRVIDIVDSTMRRCNSTACIPQRAVPLVAYKGADNNPLPVRTKAAAGSRQQAERDTVMGGMSENQQPLDADALQYVGTQAADVEHQGEYMQQSGSGSWLADSLAWTKAGADAPEHGAEAAPLMHHHGAQRAPHHGSKWISGTVHQQ